MKSFPFILLAGSCLWAVVCVVPAQAADGIELTFGWRESQLEASWRAQAQRADGSTAFPLFQLQRSGDLQNWANEGPSLQESPGGAEKLSVRLSPANAA